MRVIHAFIFAHHPHMEDHTARRPDTGDRHRWIGSQSHRNGPPMARNARGRALSDTHHFVPGPHSTRAFRDALGRFTTGVTVVTTQTEGGPLGITANSFTSVSLEPPLVLWAPARAAGRFPVFVAAEHFAVHVLGVEQAALCAAFVRDGAAFSDLPWASGPTGTPLIDGCLARFDCSRYAVYDGGDHALVLGRVLAATTRAGAPLVFSGGQYGGFGDEIPHAPKRTI